MTREEQEQLMKRLADLECDLRMVRGMYDALTRRDGVIEKMQERIDLLVRLSILKSAAVAQTKD